VLKGRHAMQDANGSRFALLLGRGDWARCRPDAGAHATLGAAWAAGADVPLAYDEAQQALVLPSRAGRFRAGRGDLPPDRARRLGSAADANGNVYWIDEGGRAISVRSAGSGRSTRFWPVEAGPVPAEPGEFAPAGPTAPPPPLALRGLAATTDGYLVAGRVPTTNEPGGLLVFDLLAGGPPLTLQWPAPWRLAPHDLAPRADGGVVVLDREQRRVWQLGRRLGMVAVDPRAPVPDHDFAAADGSDPVFDSPPPVPPRPWFDLVVTGDGGADPVSVEVLADDAVLVVDEAGRDGFALVSLYERGVLVAQASTESARDVIADADQAGFVLRGFDAALHAGRFGPEGRWQRLVVVSHEGNQAIGFDLDRDGGGLELRPDAGFLPLQRWGGVDLVAAGPARVEGDTGLRYESRGRWLPLVQQNRPRHEAEGTLLGPVFDGDEPGCTWHRVMLDGCIPAGCALRVASRAADDATLLDGLPFADEPAPVLRPDGSELPWLVEGPGSRSDAAAGHGTWELLLQRARGRHLQLRLTLAGNELATPRVQALRAWKPRFSYLQRYLPAVYREDTASADFLDRFLANFEGQFTAFEDRIAAAAALFDVRSARADTLDWLAGWLGLVLDPSLPENRRRQLIRHAVPLFKYRGTTQALRLSVQLALSDCVPDADFALPVPSQRQPWGVRIVEAFLTRLMPPALLGETTFDDVPREVLQGPQWTLAEGAEGLHRRWRAWRAATGHADATARFAPVPPGGVLDAEWSAFCQATLSIVPGLAQGFAAAWARFVGAGFAPRLGAALPSGWPADGEPDADARRAEWRRFIAGLARDDVRLARRLARWQGFVARRHLRPATMAARTGWRWPEFALLPPPTELPSATAALADWATFELLLEPMAARAHAFSVLLPIAGPDEDADQLARRIDLAARIVRLEKPAHTRFDVRPYWALLRIGQARCGLDTLLGQGSRTPGLAPPLVLGAGHLGAARVAPTGPVPRDRLLLEC
jgi:phage tail-like protein